MVRMFVLHIIFEGRVGCLLHPFNLCRLLQVWTICKIDVLRYIYIVNPEKVVISKYKDRQIYLITCSHVTIIL